MPDGRELRGVGPYGMPSLGANVGATRANDVPRRADRHGQAACGPDVRVPGFTERRPSVHHRETAATVVSSARCIAAVGQPLVAGTT
jgi:hypothetical protein